MIATLNGSQKSALDQMNRNFPAVYNGGFSQLIADMLDTLANSSVGASATGPDIDSIALGGGSFSWDQNKSSLSFGFAAGRFHNGLASVTVGAGTVALSASATNYVELDRNGTVYVNSTSFTSGRMPLYTVVTGVSTISTVTSSKDLLTLLGPASVNGTMLSTVAATRTSTKRFSALSATATQRIIAPCTGKLIGCSISSDTAVATSDTNYWQISSINKGQGGTGTQALFDTGAGNSTKATGGSALAVDSVRAVTLVTVTGGTERDVTKGDSITITLTGTGTPTTIASLEVSLDFAFTN